MNKLTYTYIDIVAEGAQTQSPEPLGPGCGSEYHYYCYGTGMETNRNDV